MRISEIQSWTLCFDGVAFYPQGSVYILDHMNCNCTLMWCESFRSLSGLQMVRDKKWNSQLWLLFCNWLLNDSCRAGSTFCFKAVDCILNLLLFPVILKMYEVYFIDESSVHSAFVSPLGHGLRPGFNFCYKLLTRIWLHPGLRACSRQQCVLCCPACKFLLHCLYTAKKWTSLQCSSDLWGRSLSPDVTEQI